MKQRVHFLTYLVKNSITFTGDAADRISVMIPANAEVTHISFEVEEENQGNGLVDIGTADNPTAFASDIDCSTKGTHIINKVFKTTKDEEIFAEAKNLQGFGGFAHLRIAYYLPSTTILEL